MKENLQKLLETIKTKDAKLKSKSEPQPKLLHNFSYYIKHLEKLESRAKSFGNNKLYKFYPFYKL